MSEEFILPAAWDALYGLDEIHHSWGILGMDAHQLHQHTDNEKYRVFATITKSGAHFTNDFSIVIQIPLPPKSYQSVTICSIWVAWSL